MWLHRAVAATGLVLADLGVDRADYGVVIDPKTGRTYLFVWPAEAEPASSIEALRAATQRAAAMISIEAMCASALFAFAFPTPNKGCTNVRHPLAFTREIIEWTRVYKSAWAGADDASRRARRDAWVLVASTGFLTAYLASELPERYPPPPGPWRRLLRTVGATATGWGVHQRPRWVAA